MGIYQCFTHRLPRGWVSCICYRQSAARGVWEDSISAIWLISVVIAEHHVTEYIRVAIMNGRGQMDKAFNFYLNSHER